MSNFKDYLKLIDRIKIDQITYPSDEKPDGSSPFNTYLIFGEYRESYATIHTEYECYFTLTLNKEDHTRLDKDLLITFITSDNEVYVETIIVSGDIIICEDGVNFDLNSLSTEEGLFQESTVQNIDCTCSDVIELKSRIDNMCKTLYDLRVQAYIAHGKKPFENFYEEY